MRFHIHRSIALLLIAGLLQQAYAAPYRSPLARHNTAGPSQKGAGDAQVQLAEQEQVDEQLRADVADALRTAPISFERNVGQLPEGVRYAAQGVASGIYLASNAMTMAVAMPREKDAEPTVPGKPGAEPTATAYTTVHVDLVGADENAKSSESDASGRVSNYYRGAKRFERVGNFGRVRFDEVYPATDVVYYGSNGKLEYDFVLGPGADVSVPSLRFDGVDDMRLSSEGDLLLSTAAGELRQSRPIAFQQIDGERVEVSAAFEQRDDLTVGFRVGEYDARLPLTIDPKIYYATGLGGPGDDFPNEVKVIEGDRVLITGQTRNPAWSLLSSAATEEAAQQSEAPFVGFILQLDPVITETGPNSYELAGSTFIGDGMADTALSGVDYFDGVIYAVGTSEGVLPETEDPIQDGPAQQGSAVKRAFVLALLPVVLTIVWLRAYGADSYGEAISVVHGPGIAPYVAVAVLFAGATFLGQPRGMGLKGVALMTLALVSGLLLAVSGVYLADVGADIGISGLGWKLVAGVMYLMIFGAANGLLSTAQGGRNGGWDGFIALWTFGAGVLVLSKILMLGAAGNEFLSGAVLMLVGGQLAVAAAVISTSRQLFGIRNLAPTDGFNLFLGIIDLVSLAVIVAWGVVGAGNIFGAGLALDRWGNFYVPLQVIGALAVILLVSQAGATLATFRDVDGSRALMAEPPRPAQTAAANVGMLKFGFDAATLAISLFYAVVVRTAADMRATAITYENWENPIIVGWTNSSNFVVTPSGLQSNLAGGTDVFMLVLKKPAIFATSVLDAASFIGGSLSPCEIVTVFGHWIGPKQLALFELDAQNEFPTLLGRARLFINGVAQRLIFASKEQLAAIVDCRLEPGGSSSPAQIQGAQVWVEFDGQQSNIVELPVSPTAPALFTTAQSGQGKTATLNQDGSVNSAANPAELGSTVVLFGTGQGVTEPFCDSAGLASTTELMPTVAQFAATVAGQPAALLFSGASPGLTCGLGQWNVTIPAALTEADANQDPTATTICVRTAAGTVIEVAVTLEAISQ